MDIPASPTRRIQRSLSAVEAMGQQRSVLTTASSARDLDNLPPLSELSPSAQAVRGAWAVVKARDSLAVDQFAALKVLLFLTFEDPSSSPAAWWTGVVLILAILLNCVAFIVGSLRQYQFQPNECADPVCVPGPDSYCTENVCHPQERPAFFAIEMWTIIIFTIDYLVRVFTVHAVPADLINPRSFDVTVDGRIKDRSNRPERHGALKTLKYILSWLNLIDLVSIIPFYVHMGYAASKETQDLGVLRILRLLRVIRIFKLGRYSEGGMLLGRTLRASLPALVLFIFLTTILTIVFGSLIYFFEMGTFMVTPSYPHGAYFRPNARGTGYELSPFHSILMGMYWTIVNTTTLGNCALYPTTNLGRIISCLVAYSGILSIALPISIVGKNFSEQYNLIYGTVGGAFDDKTNGQGVSGPSLLSLTAGIDKSLAGSLPNSAAPSPQGTIRINRSSSSRRLGRSRSNSAALEDIFGSTSGIRDPSAYGKLGAANDPATAPVSRSSTPKAAGTTAASPAYHYPSISRSTTPAALPVIGGGGGSGIGTSAGADSNVAVNVEGGVPPLVVSELQQQLRALQAELANLAPLRQEVETLRAQLRNIQQKQ